MSVSRVCDRCGKTINKGETFYTLLASVDEFVEQETTDPKTEFSVNDNNEMCKKCRIQVVKAFKNTIKLGPHKKSGRSKGPNKKKSRAKKSSKSEVKASPPKKGGRPKKSDKPKVKEGELAEPRKEKPKGKKKPPPPPTIPKD